MGLLLVAMISAAGPVHPPVRAALPTLNPTEMADATAPAKRKEATQPRISEAYGKLPVSFEANAGQADSSVKFIARGNNYSLMLMPAEAAIELRIADCGLRNKEKLTPLIKSQNPKTEIRSVKSALLRFKFIGASPAPKISGLDRLPGKTNYLVGSDPTRWRTDMPTYAKVRYQGIYPGIDLVYYGNQQQIEYDFIVAPGANPERIAFEMRGASSLTIDRAGALVAHTSAGDLRQEKPFIYQEVGGVRRQIEGRFVMLGKLQVGFSIGRYDRTKPLIIDPQISTDPRVKSAFKFGGSDDERVSGIAVDSQGSAYVTGDTRSADFPTMNSFSGTRRGSVDAFVTKLNPEGTAIVYSTYLGGSAATDITLDIAVDASGNAYVAGTTASNDFPTTVGALQTVNGANTDAYLAKLNPSGNGLVYSTFLGGNGFENAQGVAVDSDGNAYVTGGTDSANFPTMNAFQPARGGTKGNAYVAKINAMGTGLIYSTYLGGSGSPVALNGDVGSSIALGSDGSVYVAGNASSINFPTTPGAFQTSHGGSVFDAFVAKLNPSGLLSYSTYLGGNNIDTGISIAVDSSDNAYVTGGTISANFPTTAGAFQTSLRGGTGDAYVTKLNSSGTALEYSTFLAGTGGEVGVGIAVDEEGSAYVIGTTNSGDFPTKDPLQSALNGPSDVFVTIINATGSDTEFSTYLGGSANEIGASIALSDDSETVSADSETDSFKLAKPKKLRIVFAGASKSRDFPLTPFDDLDKKDQPFVFAIGNDGSSAKADLDVCIFGPDAVNKKDKPDFEVMVTNNGPETATEVELIVDLAGTVLAGARKKNPTDCGDLENTDTGKFKLTCKQASLGTGKTINVTVRATLTQELGKFMTKATAKAKEAIAKTDLLETRVEDGNPPTIIKVEPASGAPGDEVKITGKNLTGVFAVKFGDRAAIEIVSQTNTEIAVRVPRDAKTGKITVSAAGVQAISHSRCFRRRHLRRSRAYRSKGKKSS